MKSSLLFILVLASHSARCYAQTVKARQTAVEIRTEAVRPNNNATGYPLPLLASWNTGSLSTVAGMTPAHQIALIEKGHRILPSFTFPFLAKTPGGAAGRKTSTIADKNTPYYEAPLKRAATLRLPIAFVSTQWESILSDDQKYFRLPPTQNPNVVTIKAKIQNKLSPFGPIELWREVGERWSSSPLMAQIQKWYPDPPLVIFLSNNEHRKLNWTDAEDDIRYLQMYGRGRSNDFKKKIVSAAWIERYRALESGMRSALTKTWANRVAFVGYNAFGPAFLGRWDSWSQYALNTPGRIDSNPLMWDGGTPAYYTDDWNPISDYQVMSPQIQAMNWVFMQKQALRLNPRFRFGFSIWDGQEFNSTRNQKQRSKPDTYRSHGQSYGPVRYSGYAKFGLWLLRPRTLREYRGHTADLKSMEPYFLALSKTVDSVYQNETLKRFWRQGVLVPNRAHQHPYQSNLPEEFKNEDRWFLLDTNIDPARPWKLETQIPVFSLALVDGKVGQRSWLIYAHSPLQERKRVKITVPSYGQVTVDVPIGGAFYTVNEKTRSVQRIPL